MAIFAYLPPILQSSAIWAVKSLLGRDHVGDAIRAGERVANRGVASGVQLGNNVIHQVGYQYDQTLQRIDATGQAIITRTDETGRLLKDMAIIVICTAVVVHGALASNEGYFLTCCQTALRILASAVAGQALLRLNNNRKPPFERATLNGTNRERLSFSIKDIAYSEENFLQAAQNGNLDLIKKFLKEGASLQLTDSQKRTAMHYAALTGQDKLILFLQKQGVNLESVDANGRSPLHYLAYGANQAIEASDTKTVERYMRCIEWLWYWGCSFDKTDSQKNFADDYFPTSMASDSAVKEEKKRFIAKIETLRKTKNRFEIEPNYLFYPPENLVFEGGGAKGIAYVGAIESLENNGLLKNLQRVAGTSAGAIVSLLLALGYSSSELRTAMQSADFKTFLDHGFENEIDAINGLSQVVTNGKNATLAQFGSAIKGAIQLIGASRGEAQGSVVQQCVDRLQEMYIKGGVCKGKIILEWLEALVEEKTKDKYFTFGDLKRAILDGASYKHLVIYATQVEGETELVCISTEDSKWDNVPLADAIRASMSIPFVFEPYTLREKRMPLEPPTEAPQLGRFVDGGMIKNLPFDAFDATNYLSTNPEAKEPCCNRQTLAFHLSAPKKQTGLAASKPKKLDFSDILIQVASVYFNSEVLGRDSNRVERYLKERIININTLGIGTLDFSISSQNQERLIQAAWLSNQRFLEEQEKIQLDHPLVDPYQILGIFKISQIKHRLCKVEKFSSPEALDDEKNSDLVSSETRAESDKVALSDPEETMNANGNDNSSDVDENLVFTEERRSAQAARK